MKIRAGPGEIRKQISLKPVTTINHKQEVAVLHWITPPGETPIQIVDEAGWASFAALQPRSRSAPTDAVPSGCPVRPCLNPPWTTGKQQYAHMHTQTDTHTQSDTHTHNQTHTHTHIHKLTAYDSQTLYSTIVCICAFQSVIEGRLICCSALNSSEWHAKMCHAVILVTTKLPEVPRARHMRDG